MVFNWESSINNGTLNTMNTQYNTLRNDQNVSNTYNATNQQAMLKIIDAINQNMAQLNMINSRLSLLNNVNQDNLIKKQQLLNMQNDDLTKQLKELEFIQSNIENKNRFIQQTDDNVRKQQQNINVLISAIIISILFLGNIVLYMYNQTSYDIFIYSFYTLILSYIILYIYSYNIFYFNTAITNLFNKNTERRIGQYLDSWSDIQDTSEKDQAKRDWIYKNCKCAIETEEEEGNISYFDGNTYLQDERKGYFYHDGTAPQQLLLESPDSNYDTNEYIDWVDNDNKSAYDNNTNYYNSTHRDPRTILKNSLYNSTTLVNDRTKTVNL
jgi:hypothetical protein